MGGVSAQFGERVLEAPGFGANALLGTDLALRDGRAVVTAFRAVGNEGRARVFEFDAATGDWAPVQTLSLASPSTTDGYGASCAFHSDTIVIGATSATAGGIGNAGAASIHQRVSGTTGPYVTSGPIHASDSEGGARFGAAVAVASNSLLVGAPERSFATSIDARGAVYVFERLASGLPWGTTERLKIRPLSGQTGERFGASLDISASSALIGAPRGGSLYGSTGRAYVYVRDFFGTWSEQDLLSPGEDAGGFGTSVGIYGSFAVVGAPLDESDTGSWINSGSAFVYERSGSSWNLVAKLIAPEERNNLQFGNDVAIDDGRIVVGTLDGRAYVFSQRDLGAGIEWFLSGTLVAESGASGEDYARAVAIDGDFTGIGARTADPTPTTMNGGRAYLYRYPSEFASHCFADAGDCPCSGDADAGCTNSTGSGALLKALGSGSLAAYDLALRVSGLPGGSLVLGLASTNTARLVLGDGILCLGGPIIRIGVRGASPAGIAHFGASAAIGIPLPSPSDVLHYQVWYRDTPIGSCGAGSNLTNAVQVQFGS